MTYRLEKRTQTGELLDQEEQEVFFVLYGSTAQNRAKIFKTLAQNRAKILIIVPIIHAANHNSH